MPAGSVLVGGQELTKLDEKGLALFRRRHIGMIFQFFNLLDDLPALDNVALAAQLIGASAARARKRALELMGERFRREWTVAQRNEPFRVTS